MRRYAGQLRIGASAPLPEIGPVPLVDLSAPYENGQELAALAGWETYYCYGGGLDAIWLRRSSKLVSACVVNLDGYFTINPSAALESVEYGYLADVWGLVNCYSLVECPGDDITIKAKVTCRNPYTNTMQTCALFARAHRPEADSEFSDNGAILLVNGRGVHLYIGNGEPVPDAEVFLDPAQYAEWNIRWTIQGTLHKVYNNGVLILTHDMFVEPPGVDPLAGLRAFGFTLGAELHYYYLAGIRHFQVYAGIVD